MSDGSNPAKLFSEPVTLKCEAKRGDVTCLMLGFEWRCPDTGRTVIRCAAHKPEPAVRAHVHVTPQVTEPCPAPPFIPPAEGEKWPGKPPEPVVVMPPVPDYEEIQFQDLRKRSRKIGGDLAARIGEALGEGHHADDTPESWLPDPPDYSKLRDVLRRAVEQASDGKGRVRHATGQDAFEEQQIVKLGLWMGSTHFEIGQACKKAIESTRLEKTRAVSELLGAINYLAAAVLVLERGQ